MLRMQFNKKGSAMQENKRLFIGIKVDLSEKTEKFYSSLPSILDEAAVKWVKPEYIHITLKFIGEVETEKIPQIQNKLKFVAKKFDEFEVMLKGVGVFRDFFYPKVIWFGLRNCEKIESLKNTIENSLSDLGFEIDYRKFTPHLTIGRFKEAGSVKALKKTVSENQDQYFQTVPVKEFTLFESILKNEGPEYKIIESYPLGKEEEFKEFRF